MSYEYCGKICLVVSTASKQALKPPSETLIRNASGARRRPPGKGVSCPTAAMRSRGIQHPKCFYVFSHRDTENTEQKSLGVNSLNSRNTFSPLRREGEWKGGMNAKTGNAHENRNFQNRAEPATTPKTKLRRDSGSVKAYAYRSWRPPANTKCFYGFSENFICDKNNTKSRDRVRARVRTEQPSNRSTEKPNNP